MTNKLVRKLTEKINPKIVFYKCYTMIFSLYLGRTKPRCFNHVTYSLCTQNIVALPVVSTCLCVTFSDTGGFAGQCCGEERAQHTKGNRLR